MCINFLMDVWCFVLEWCGGGGGVDVGVGVGWVWSALLLLV